MKYTEKQHLLSHVFSPETLSASILSITARIKETGDKPYASVEQQLALLDQLTRFDFGCYLIQNQGINGYWTHYMLTHPWYGRKTGKSHCGTPLSELESFLLDRAPTMLATQQRFDIFLKENQQQVSEHRHLASIPCGMMGELLYLNYEGIEDIQLTGIDYDPHTLEDAASLARERDYQHPIHFLEKNAWNLGVEDAFDLISSNGLNIYEPSDEKVTALYQQFYQALKKGGKLVTSFLTFPPTLSTACEWDLSRVSEADLLLQKIIFVDIIDAKWQCYRSSEQTYQQLSAVGFRDIRFIYDEANMFPTVVGIKS